MKRALSMEAICLMQRLMCNPHINKKVELAPGEGKTYARFDIRKNGIVVLGETKVAFWNQLCGCQHKLSFKSWALAVWDALCDLSKDGNKTAIEQGLSVEIANKAQREEDYDYVVERLHECYTHVCNSKGTDSAGSQDENGSSVNTRKVYVNGEPVTININADNLQRSIKVFDSTGRNYLKFKLGVVDVSVDHD